MYHDCVWFDLKETVGGGGKYQSLALFASIGGNYLKENVLICGH